MTGGGAVTRRQWVRARRRVTGNSIASVVVQIDRPEIIVLEPLTGMLRVSSDEAVAVGLCLRAAVLSLPHLRDDDLVIEADRGEGWKPVIQEAWTGRQPERP